MKRQLVKHKNTKIARQRYKVWLNQGQYDLNAAKLSYKHEFYEWSAYQAEQAVEKSLKSILVHAGYRPPRMHKLPVLLGMCNQVNQECRKTKFDFKHLESFTFISRYPFLIPGKDITPHELISASDAEKALDQAIRFLAKVEGILRYPSSEGTEVAIEYAFTKAEIQSRLEDVKAALVREFNPEKIILFGSFARDGLKMKAGTMDILVIANTELPFIERIKKARIATRGGTPVIEALVYTPEEFKFMIEEEGEGFLESALEEGKVVYEKNNDIAS